MKSRYTVILYLLILIASYSTASGRISINGQLNGIELSNIEANNTIPQHSFPPLQVNPDDLGAHDESVIVIFNAQSLLGNDLGIGLMLLNADECDGSEYSTLGNITNNNYNGSFTHTPPSQNFIGNDTICYSVMDIFGQIATSYAIITYVPYDCSFSATVDLNVTCDILCPTGLEYDYEIVITIPEGHALAYYDIILDQGNAVTVNADLSGTLVYTIGNLHAQGSIGYDIEINHSFHECSQHIIQDSFIINCNLPEFAISDDSEWQVAICAEQDVLQVSSPMLCSANGCGESGAFIITRNLPSYTQSEFITYNNNADTVYYVSKQDFDLLAFDMVNPCMEDFYGVFDINLLSEDTTIHCFFIVDNYMQNEFIVYGHQSINLYSQLSNDCLVDCPQLSVGHEVLCSNNWENYCITTNTNYELVLNIAGLPFQNYILKKFLSSTDSLITTDSLGLVSLLIPYPLDLESNIYNIAMQGSPNCAVTIMVEPYNCYSSPYFSVYMNEPIDPNNITCDQSSLAIHSDYLCANPFDLSHCGEDNYGFAIIADKEISASFDSIIEFDPINTCMGDSGSVFSTNVLTEFQELFIGFGIYEEALNLFTPIQIGLLNIENCTGINPVLTNSIKVFPNPVHKELHIVLPTEALTPSTIKLLNMNGSIVINESIKPSLTLNTTRLTNGMYLLHITQGKNVYIQKISIQH